MVLDGIGSSRVLLEVQIVEIHDSAASSDPFDLNRRILLLHDSLSGFAGDLELRPLGGEHRAIRTTVESSVPGRLYGKGCGTGNLLRHELQDIRTIDPAKHVCNRSADIEMVDLEANHGRSLSPGGEIHLVTGRSTAFAYIGCFFGDMSAVRFRDTGSPAARRKLRFRQRCKGLLENDHVAGCNWRSACRGESVGGSVGGRACLRIRDDSRGAAKFRATAGAILRVCAA